jgi:hypothetical protein
MQRRNARSEAILRDILRRRRGFEWPTAIFDEEPWQADVGGVEGEAEITFRTTEPRAASPARRLARWLFMKGGMSVVVILGLMAIGLIAGILGGR